MVVDRPGKDEGNGGEETCGRGVYPYVSPSRVGSERASKSDKKVSRAAEESVEDNIEASVSRAIREKGGDEDDGEGEEVWRS